MLAVTTALVVQITLPVGPWRATFPTDIQLLTNERAYRDPATPGVHISKDWVVTSGSLFSYQGAGWTGPIDGQTPDIDSAEATDSAVFRVVTRRRDFGNVRVRMQLKVEDMTATARTPRKDYDGVHVFLRYTSPNELYTVDLCRRDDTLTIKKKVPDSSAPDGGTYTTLAQVPYGCQHDRWASFAVEIQDTAAGVKFSLRSGSTTLMTAVDNGAGGTPPLYSAGRVGVRGDNTRFLFRDFTVASVG